MGFNDDKFGAKLDEFIAKDPNPIILDMLARAIDISEGRGHYLCRTTEACSRLVDAGLSDELLRTCAQFVEECTDDRPHIPRHFIDFVAQVAPFVASTTELRSLL